MTDAPILTAERLEALAKSADDNFFCRIPGYELAVIIALAHSALNALGREEARTFMNPDPVPAEAILASGREVHSLAVSTCENLVTAHHVVSEAADALWVAVRDQPEGSIDRKRACALSDARNVLALLLSVAPPGAHLAQVAAELGFDPTNHHNAARCPYCITAPTPNRDKLREDVERIVVRYLDLVSPGEVVNEFLALLPDHGGGVPDGLALVSRQLLIDVKSVLNQLAMTRNKIGPLATQAQMFGHYIAEVLAAAPTSQEGA